MFCMQTKIQIYLIKNKKLINTKFHKNNGHIKLITQCGSENISE